MGIPHGMDITHRTIDWSSRNFHGGYHFGAIYVPQCSNENPVVSGILQEDRGVPDLQFHADLKKEVCLTQGLDEARFGLDEVGIFLAFGEHGDFNLVTPNFLCQVP
jgi:hypothetical protein